jgi:hypothetical protein
VVRDRPHAHGAGAGGQHQVVDRSGGGEERVKRRPVGRVDLGHLNRRADALRAELTRSSDFRAAER